MLPANPVTPCPRGVLASLPGWLGALPLWAGASGLLLGQEARPFPGYSDQTAREYILRMAEGRQPLHEGEWLFLARVRNSLGLKDGARKLAREGLEAHPGSIPLRLLLADLLVREDRLEEAKPVLEEAVRLAPRDPKARIELGMALDQMGERDAARKEYRESIRLSDTHARPRLFLGRSHLEQGEAHEALVHLERAREMQPRNANIHYLLWRALSLLEREEEARAALAAFEAEREEEARRADQQNLERDDRRSMRELAASLHREEALRAADPGEAERHLLQAAEIAPHSPDPWRALASFYQKRGEPSRARGPLESLVRLLPRHAGYRADLGTLMLLSGEAVEGVASLERALELDPVQPQALQNLARFHLGSGTRLQKALELARRLAGEQPLARNHDLLAWALYANGRREEAAEAAREAVRLEPGQPVYRRRLRMIEERNRQ